MKKADYCHCPRLPRSRRTTSQDHEGRRAKKKSLTASFLPPPPTEVNLFCIFGSRKKMERENYLPERSLFSLESPPSVCVFFFASRVWKEERKWNRLRPFSRKPDRSVNFFLTRESFFSPSCFAFARGIILHCLFFSLRDLFTQLRYYHIVFPFGKIFFSHSYVWDCFWICNVRK